jgi:hypothetical protein
MQSALASLPLDALRRDQKETNLGDESWPPIVAGRLKTRSLFWRALTMGLLKAARGETPRYAVESVVSLLTGKLGRWLQPVKDGRRPWPLVDKNVNELAAAAVELDLYVGFLDGARARITYQMADMAAGASIASGRHGNSASSTGRRAARTASFTRRASTSRRISSAPIRAFRKAIPWTWS